MGPEKTQEGQAFGPLGLKKAVVMEKNVCRVSASSRRNRLY